LHIQIVHAAHCLVISKRDVNGDLQRPIGLTSMHDDVLAETDSAHQKCPNVYDKITVLKNLARIESNGFGARRHAKEQFSNLIATANGRRSLTQKYRVFCIEARHALRIASSQAVSELLVERGHIVLNSHTQFPPPINFPTNCNHRFLLFVYCRSSNLRKAAAVAELQLSGSGPTTLNRRTGGSRFVFCDWCRRPDPRVLQPCTGERRTLDTRTELAVN